jgi:hypothetical protein
MKIRPAVALFLACLAVSLAPMAGAQQATVEPMQGVPPARESQVNMGNYRDYPRIFTPSLKRHGSWRLR